MFEHFLFLFRLFLAFLMFIENSPSNTPEARIRHIEFSIRDSQFEIGVVTDIEGHELFRIAGTPTSVVIPKALEAQTRNQIFTHNHLRGTIPDFSAQDIQMASYLNLYQIRMVTVDDETGKTILCKASRGDHQYWPFIYDLPERTQVEMHSAYAKLSGGSDYRRATQAVHGVWEVIFAKWQLKYSCAPLN